MALNKFRELIVAQHGDPSIIERKEELLSNKTVEFKSTENGYIETIDALKIGVAASRLGAGRETKEDVIDLFVGIDLHKKIGDRVQKGDVIATLYVNEKGVDEALALMKQAVNVGPNKLSIDLIKKTIQ